MFKLVVDNLANGSYAANDTHSDFLYGKNKNFIVKLDLQLDAIKIGPGCDYTDLYGVWADGKETEDNGCLLIRPDLYVAWRQQSVQPNAGKLLLQAMRTILCK